MERARAPKPRPGLRSGSRGTGKPACLGKPLVPRHREQAEWASGPLVLRLPSDGELPRGRGVQTVCGEPSTHGAPVVTSTAQWPRENGVRNTLQQTVRAGLESLQTLVQRTDPMRKCLPHRHLPSHREPPSPSSDIPNPSRPGTCLNVTWQRPNNFWCKTTGLCD